MDGAAKRNAAAPVARPAATRAAAQLGAPAASPATDAATAPASTPASTPLASLAACPAPVPGDANVGGLRWHADRWWWSDAPGAALYLWTPGSEALRSRLSDSVAAFAFCQSGRALLAQSKWLCFADLATPPAQGLGRRTPRAAVAVDPAEPRTAISDGDTDRAGNFVFGTAFDADSLRAIGSFYQYSLRHGLRRLALPTASVAHSICFSPDGATMYFSDAPTRRILQCDYNAADARVANVRTFAELPDGQPRGAVVDSAGCLWSAQAGAGRVVQYAPDGALLRSIAVATVNPARPAFGGPELAQLMVGSVAGGLHVIDGAGARGLPAVLFDDRKP
ncbi:SMP-30/gluconolactonase/LRE family protein [Pseudoduganella sp. LjRoot289]|uniref:SMP-30/gluconolactonase/LRE family protein n=1 Tax=Pseudoduganella sp. LjRoot289 TaxID=3342314 RepID=UPI003ECE167D